MGDMEQSFAERIIACNIPVITSGFYYYDHYTDCVIEENIAGTFMPVDRFLKHGCTKIGFIGNSLNCMGYLKRYMGYKGAVKSFDLEHNCDWEITNWKDEYEYDFDIMAKKISKIQNRPDAFVCANDRVGEVEMSSVDEDQIIQMMVGRELKEKYPRREKGPYGELALRVEKRLIPSRPH